MWFSVTFPVCSKFPHFSPIRVETCYATYLKIHHIQNTQQNPYFLISQQRNWKWWFLMLNMFRLTIHVRVLSPINESLSTCVSLLALKGKWAPLLPNALIHSFNASKLLLISAPSILVWRSELDVSAPLSFPNKKKVHSNMYYLWNKQHFSKENEFGTELLARIFQFYRFRN